MSKKKHEIAVLERKEFGKNANRRARCNGLVPVNVYRKGVEGSRTFYVKANEWDILNEEDFSLAYLINGSERIGAVVQEVQHNYLKNYVVHVDFHEVDLTKDVTVLVKIIPSGTPDLGTEGVLEQQIHELELVGKPDALPDVLEISVDGLALDQHILVGELKLPEGVVAKHDADAIVFHVGRAAREEEPEPAAADADAAAAEPEVLTERKRDDKAEAADQAAAKPAAGAKKK
ncbi:MAG: 50S ribosomal protein L25 [Victivallaceae bacterium]|nr:50S ribosomal protein L25 [Victivallaceae bacterium]